MPSKEKPYVLLVAEAIYSKVCEIKKKNPELTTINESMQSKTLLEQQPTMI